MVEVSTKQTRLSWSQVRPRFARGVQVFLRVFSSRRLFWLWMVGSLVVASVLVYLAVWQPLRQEVQLPAGIPATNPSLNQSLLQQLLDELTVRRRHAPGSYFEAASAFNPLTPGLSPVIEEGQSDNEQVQ